MARLRQLIAVGGMTAIAALLKCSLATIPATSTTPKPAEIASLVPILKLNRDIIRPLRAIRADNPWFI